MYNSKTDGPDLIKQIEGLRDTDKKIWSDGVKTFVEDTLKLKFGEETKADLWRDRYNKAVKAAKPEAKAFKNAIQKRMRELNIKYLKDLEKKVGIPQQRLSDGINGTWPFKKDELEKLEAILGRIDDSELNPVTESPELPQGTSFEMKFESHVAPAGKPYTIPESDKEQTMMPIEHKDILSSVLQRHKTAIDLLQDQWDRFTSSKKWCDPYKINTALQVLKGHIKPFDVKKQNGQ